MNAAPAALRSLTLRESLHWQPAAPGRRAAAVHGSSVQITRAISESKSNVSISFCTLRNIFITGRLLERDASVRPSESGPLAPPGPASHWPGSLGCPGRRGAVSDIPAHPSLVAQPRRAAVARPGSCPRHLRVGPGTGRAGSPNLYSVQILIIFIQ